MAGLQQLPRLGVSACVWRGEDVLLIQRAKPPLIGAWSLPGGHVEAGETVREAVHRELLEETGVSASLDQLVGIFDVIRRDDAGLLTHHYAIACYTGAWTAGEPRAASDAATARWMAPSDLRGLVFVPNVREAIAQARPLVRA
jgi:8-oxo-dGTP diphosphatase